MKVISMSAVEILPALLNKTKTQTIRPAWKEKFVGNKEGGLLFKTKKPPRFKVGEEVNLMWKQRGKFKFFCKKHGIHILSCSCSVPKGDSCETFPKILGTVKITEVFKIEMGINVSGGFYVSTPNAPKSVIENEEFFDEQLAKRDGFKSAGEMFKWFDETHDLSIPRSFHVYRWRWS